MEDNRKHSSPPQANLDQNPSNDINTSITVTPATIASLAEESRTSITIRHTLSEPAPLRQLTTILTSHAATAQTTGTSIAALKCIGNACIDNDSARETLTEILPFDWISTCLASANAGIQWTTVKVLYNLCSEHEGAQRQLYQASEIWYALLKLLVSPAAAQQQSEDRGLLIDVLFWITGQKKVPKDSAAAATAATTAAVAAAEEEVRLPRDILTRIIVLPCYYYDCSTAAYTVITLDERATLVEISLTFIRDPVVQRQVVEWQLVPFVWQIFLDLDEKLCQEEEQISHPTSEVVGQQQEPPSETTQLLKPLLSSIYWCLSDIAAAKIFQKVYSICDPLIEGLIILIEREGAATGIYDGYGGCTADAYVEFPRELKDAILLTEVLAARKGMANKGVERASGKHRRLAAACQVFGNLLGADTLHGGFLVSSPTNNKEALHKPLLRSLVAQQRRQEQDGAEDAADVQHSIAGLLMVFARRVQTRVREVIGEDDLTSVALRGMWEAETPQLRQDCVALVRALGKDCPENQRRFEGLAAEMMAKAAEERSAANNGADMTEGRNVDASGDTAVIDGP
ncbi:hypothetical protein B0A50_08644 [Salinomyces thailandicus]|uniref:Copper transport protein 86 n=1 Tax=Salinomyces thailandicus TaxID=706561 RepID=A0A4U0TJD7_9PEZI|nr:hypothetical protein B0A50_08644 [Salinomyces thailandica]